MTDFWNASVKLVAVSAMLLSCTQSKSGELDASPSDFSISIVQATRNAGEYDFEFELSNGSQSSRCFEWFQTSPWIIHFISSENVKYELKQDTPDFISQSRVDKARKEVVFMEIGAGSRIRLTAQKAVAKSGAIFERDGSFVRQYRDGEFFYPQISLILYDCSFGEKKDAIAAGEYLRIVSKISETMLVY